MMPVAKFIQGYKDRYNHGMLSLDINEVQRAIAEIKNAALIGKKIYVAGNGGSSAISNHLCCDFMKGANVQGFSSIQPISLSCNTPLITALANDLGYEETIVYQLENCLQTNDVVILISSSGNSPNIVKAAKYVKDRGERLIAMTGFDGGMLNTLADIKIHIPVSNYGVVEDCHQSVMHIISQYIKMERGG